MIEFIESVLHYWPAILSVLALALGATAAIYLAVRVKIPDLTEKVSNLEEDTKALATKDFVQQEVRRVDEDIKSFIEQCRNNREACHSNICREISQLSDNVKSQLEKFSFDLNKAVDNVDATRVLVQGQALQVARIDERVRVLLGARTGSVDSITFEETGKR